jgi:hypothetical protein
MDMLGYAYHEHAYAYPMHNDTFECIIGWGLGIRVRVGWRWRLWGLRFSVFHFVKCKV